MNIRRSSSGTLPATSRRKKSLAKRLYTFGSLPSFCLFSKRALLNERTLPHEVIPYFYPANLPLDLQMIIVGAISSLSEMLNDFACRLDEDDPDADSVDACDHDSDSSQDGHDDSDSDRDDDHDSFSCNVSDDDASQLADIQDSFRILALDGFKVAVWDELCDGVLLHRTGAKRPKGDICLAIIVSYALPDVLISTHLEYVVRYLHFWRGKIAIKHTHDIEDLGRELHAPILFWFGDVGRHGSSSPTCIEDRAFGALPGLMINQRSGLSPKTTIEKSKALIDSIHEFKKEEPTLKSIAIGMDRLDMRIHTIGGMVIFHRGLLYSDTPCNVNLMLRAVLLEPHFKDNPDSIVLQRVHLASDKLQQWVHNDEPFDEETECWYPYSCTWCLEPSSLVVSLLVVVSTPSGIVDDNDLIKLERWAEKAKAHSQFKGRRIAQDVLDLQLGPSFDLLGPITHATSVKDYVVRYTQSLEFEQMSQVQLRQV
ncbi:hypothetical protein BGW37DRAFT_510212 [Umbelopsis sp. PMI_123]|nr:hypothetical protein BGW37DRAFT_510212 [Umbelopsis sp. PMI_123]